MEQERLQVLADFETVWARVCADREGTARQSPPTADAGTAALEALLGETMALWARYSAFSRQTAGEARARFTAMAQDTRESIRTLQAEYFLRAGDLCHPAARPSPLPGVLTGMRRAYEQELQLAQELGDGAFTALGDAARARAAALRGMIEGLMGK